MGIIALIIAAVIEFSFGLYCIITKSYHKKIRNWIHIGALGIFTVFVLIRVIQWSFRWELLFVLLLIWAVIGIISLILAARLKKRDGKVKVYKPSKTVLKAIAILILTAAAVTPALVFPQYRELPVTGGYKVANAVYTYTDTGRQETFNDTGENRKVTVKFWYPENAGGRYPLVVFSHGSFGIGESNFSTFMELASNGYVVCSVEHPYHSLFTKDTSGKITIGDRSFMQEVIDVNNGVYDEKTGYELSKKWMKVRTGDINFVLDTVGEKVRSGSPDAVYRLMDTGKTGLLGHSLGGAADVQLGRDRDDIGAVIDLDGSMLGEYLDYTGGKYTINHDIYPVPLLCIYTDDMKNGFAAVTDPDMVLPEKLIAETAPDAHEIYISGTNHMSLTDLPLFSPLLAKMISGSVEKIGKAPKADKYYVINTMNSLVLKFFDSYLKGEGSFQADGTY